MSADPRPAPPEFREQLTVPIRWWLVALFFIVSVFVAVGFYLRPANGFIAAMISTGVVAAVLVPYGSLKVLIDHSGLTVGASRIDWAWVAGARALDAEAARHRLGPGADARAHLAVRPYVAEAVEVTIHDPADPHPYWLVSSRRAGEFADAVNARAEAATSEEAPDAGS